MDKEEKDRQYEDFLADVDRLKEGAGNEAEFLEHVTAVSGAGPEPEEMGSLGDRVKNIRRAKGLSLADMASRIGFDETYLERIESDEVYPPLGVLIKLGKALGMTMGYFISGGESRPYPVVRGEEARKVARRASSEDEKYGYTYHALAPGKADRHMEPFLITLEPAPEEAPSTHEGQEVIYVLEGKMEAILGQDRIVLSPGDAIYYDSSVPHLVRCVDGPSTKILAVLYAGDK